jgi:hypothetical protein
MAWLGSISLAILKRVAPALVVWYFTQARGEQHRESDRLRWWGFKQRSELTKTKADDALAVYLQARFSFHDSPEAKAAKVAEILDTNRARYVDSPRGGQ